MSEQHQLPRKNTFQIIVVAFMLLSSIQMASARSLLERISFHPRSDGRGYVVWFDVSEPLPRGNYAIQHRGNDLTLTLLNTFVLSDVAQVQPQGPVYSYSIEPSENKVVFRFKLDQAVQASAYPDRSGDMILNLEYRTTANPAPPTTKNANTTTNRSTPTRTNTASAPARNTAPAATPSVRITKPVLIDASQPVTPPSPQTAATTQPITPTETTAERIRNNARTGVNATMNRIQDRANTRRSAPVQPTKPVTTPSPRDTTPAPTPSIRTAPAPSVTVITPDGRTVPSSLPSPQMATPEVVIPEPERRTDGQPIIQPFGQPAQPIITPTTQPTQPVTQPIITPSTPQPVTQPIIQPSTPQHDETNPVVDLPPTTPTPSQPATSPSTQPVQPSRPVVLPPPVLVSYPATNPVASNTVTQPVTSNPVTSPQNAAGTVPRFIFMEDHSSPQKKALEEEAYALARHWKRSTNQDQKQRLGAALDRKLSQIFETEQYLWRRKVSESNADDARDQEARIAQRQEVKSVILDEWRAALLGTAQ